MNAQQFARSYKAVSVETASPGKLTLMLFDGALNFMACALLGFEEDSFRARNEAVNNNLIRAQAILSELQSGLHFDAAPEFCDAMYRLYDYMFRELQAGNLNKEAAPIRNAERILKEIRDAWAEMLNRHEAPPEGEVSRTA